MALLDLEPLSIDASHVVQQLSAGVIQGLPQVNQLNEPTADHAADENARMNCVFACNAAVSRKVGKHPEANGDAIKDGCAHYGQGYTGGADEEVVESDGCLDHKWGIHADTFHASNRTALLNECRRQADAGNFTMVTIPSMWGSQPSQPGYNPDSPNFWTHAVVYCGYVGDTHYLMNPWGGFIMTYSSAELALRLCYLKIYTLRAAQGAPMANIPNGWTDDGKTLHNPVNSFVVVNGIRDFVLANHWDPADVPLNNEAPRNPVEYGNPKLGEGAVQYFRASGQVTWTKSNDTVFRTWNGQEMLALLALIGSLTASVRTDQALIGTLQQQVDALKAQHSASDDAIKAMATALSAFPVQK